MEHPARREALDELLRVSPRRFARQRGPLRPVVEQVLREFLRCGLLSTASPACGALRPLFRRRRELLYDDESVGVLLYLTRGGSRVPKEQLEVYADGKTAQLHNFARLDVFEGDGACDRVLDGVDRDSSQAAVAREAMDVIRITLAQP